MIVLNYQKLTKAIEESGIKIQILAEKIGFSAQGLSRSLVKERLTVRNYQNLCNYLSRSPCEFFEEQDMESESFLDLSLLKASQGSGEENLQKQILLWNKELKEMKRRLIKLEDIAEKIDKNHNSDKRDKTQNPVGKRISDRG